MQKVTSGFFVFFFFFLSWAFQETSQKASRNSISTPQFRICKRQPTRRLDKVKGERENAHAVLLPFEIEGVNYIYKALHAMMMNSRFVGYQMIKRV